MVYFEDNEICVQMNRAGIKWILVKECYPFEI